MKKVGIFTTNSFEKLHPRIQMQKEILEQNGYWVSVVKTSTKKDSFFFESINLFTFKYFKWGAIRNFRNKLDEFDIVHVYDFQLLPLAKKAQKKGKKVVYETLDDNVYLTFYDLQKRLPLLKILKKIIIQRYSSYERKIAREFCDETIVNSPNLLENFDTANLIYYASNLEGAKLHSFNSSKQTAFLYLGKLSEAKGAKEYPKILSRFNMKCFVVGGLADDSAKTMSLHANVDYLGSHSSDTLLTKIEGLCSEYNLIGFSIIKPQNKSYALQEANKDIDYMSIGLPIVGNKRKPTFEKIKKGAGVLFSDDNGIMNLIENKNKFYEDCSEKSREQYLENYSKSEFSERLLKVYSNLD